MHFLRRATVVMLAVTLAMTVLACSRDGRIKKAEKVDLDAIVLPQDAVLIRTLWQNDAAKASARDDSLRLDLAAAGRLVLVVSTSGDFFAVDGVSGDTVWRHELNARISGGVGSGDGLALAVDEDGMVYALDVEDGRLRWQSRVLAEVLTPPVAGQGITVVRTADGRVIGLSSDDGTQRWAYRKAEQGLTVRGSAPPLISGGVVYNAFAGGEVTAHEIASGNLLWEAGLVLPEGSNEIERLADIDSRPLLTRTHLYAGSAYSGQLTALELANVGFSLWNAAVGPAFDLTQDATRLFLVDDDGLAHAVHRGDGRILWSQEQLRDELSSSLVVQGAYLLVAGTSGALYALHTTDGTVQGLLRFGGDKPSAFRNFGGRAFLLGRDGTLAAFAIDDSATGS